MKDKNEQEEKVSVRHKINAEETFTLAKDVYDIRTTIKNIYGNRAVIYRRLNFLSLTVSLIFTLLYVAYILCSGLLGKIGLKADIVIYCLLGVYAALFIVLMVIAVCELKAKAKNIKKFKKTLSVFRLVLRLVSLAIAIAALVFSNQSEGVAALKILLIIFSVITLIIQLIPLMFGGVGKLARWLLSPVKIKHRFSAVALEWYELTLTSSSDSKSVKRVSKKYYDEIGVCLDNYLIPELGRRYVSSIKATHILNAVQSASEEDKPIVEGILKTVFEYATECGYVTFNPCRDLEFEGSIEEEEKQRKGIKSRLASFGKKIGMSILDKYIDKNSDNDG